MDWNEEFHKAAMSYRNASVILAPEAYERLVELAKQASIADTAGAKLSDEQIEQFFEVPGLNIHGSLEPREIGIFLQCCHDMLSTPPAPSVADAKLESELRSEIKELRESIAARDSLITSMRKQIAPSVADAAGASEDARDAARYRWLRGQEHSLETQQRDKGIVNGPSCYHDVEGIRELKWGDDLDAAIDAAIAKESGK